MFSCSWPFGVQPGTERYSARQKFARYGFSKKTKVTSLEQFVCSCRERSYTALCCSNAVYYVFQAGNCTIRLWGAQGFKIFSSFLDSTPQKFLMSMVICRQLQRASPQTFAHSRAAIGFIFLNTQIYFFPMLQCSTKMCEWVCTLCRYKQEHLICVQRVGLSIS